LTDSANPEVIQQADIKAHDSLNLDSLSQKGSGEFGSLDGFQLVRRVGDGKIATVFEAIRKQDGKTYALKSSHDGDFPDWTNPFLEVQLL